MSGARTRGLALAASLVTSILAGVDLNRGLIEMPAWQRTGPLRWAAFSRHADLGATATVLYPGVAFASAILTAGAAVSFHREGSQPPAAAVPIYGAALMTLGGLLATTRAAPIMLSVRGMADDAVALQRALDGFQLWGNVRGLFQVLAYAATLWSLAVLT